MVPNHHKDLPEADVKKYRLVAPGNTKLAIFVHGIWSGYLKQWHGFHTTLFAHAHTDPILAQWNFAFIGYDWNRIQSYAAIANLISEECRRAEKGTHRYANKHVECALIGFSLGTLGIREYVANCAMQPTNMDIKKVLLFGPPLAGSYVASLGSDVFDSIAPGSMPVLRQLAPGSPTLRMLRDWSTCAFNSHPWPKNELFVGVRDGMVHSQSASYGPWPTDATPIHSNFDGHTMRRLVGNGPSSDLYQTLKAELA